MCRPGRQSYRRPLRTEERALPLPWPSLADALGGGSSAKIRTPFSEGTAISMYEYALAVPIWPLVLRRNFPKRGMGMTLRGWFTETSGKSH